MRRSASAPKLVYVATHPVSADLLLRGQLAFMREHGFDVTVVAAPGPALDRVEAREKIHTERVDMAREIDPRSDVRALGRLIAVLRRLGPDIVNAGTPKGGLLGMMAARALNVPVRIYLLRGLRLETLGGIKRSILQGTERVASACAHDVVCVSQSLARVVAEGGHASRAKLTVLGEGSSNGVDLERFSFTDARAREGRSRLAALGVPDDAPVAGFVGRLAHDKGIDELLDAFARVRCTIPAAHLLLVGGDLADEDAPRDLVERVRRAENVTPIPAVTDLAPLYATMRVLVLPSFREGFPNVVLEAAAMGVPCVGFRSTGVVDAIVDGETGALAARGDRDELAEKLLSFMRDAELARVRGAAARVRVETSFSNTVVWGHWLALYRARLEKRGIVLP